MSNELKDIKAIGGIGYTGYDVRKELIKREQARSSQRTPRSELKHAVTDWRSAFEPPTSED